MAGLIRSTVVPDFKLQMSKKIAQLTKVICQLNNRNEDYEFDLQELSDQYESEIENILKETAEKVNSFKRQLEDKRDEKKALEMAKMLEEQHKKEKEKIVKELSNLHKKYEDNIKSMSAAASRESENLSREIQKIKQDLKEQCAKCDQQREESCLLKKEYEASLERKKLEVEEAIQMGNKKFSDMLARRMDIEDELNSKIMALELGLENKEKELMGLKTDVSTEKEALEQKLCHTNQAHKDSETAWKDQVTRLIAQLGQEKENLHSQQIRADEAEVELRLTTGKLSQLQAQTAMIDKKSVDLQEALEVARDGLLRKSDELDRLQAQKSLVEVDLDGHKDQIQQMTDRLRNMTDDSEYISQAWSADKENWESRIGEVESEKIKLEQQLSLIRMDSNETKGCLIEKTRELNEVQKNLTERKEELGRMREAWENDKVSGTASLENTKEEAKRVLRDVENDLVGSHEEIKRLKQGLEAVKKNMSESAAQALKEMEKRMVIQLTKSKEEYDSVIESLNKSHQQTQSDLEMRAQKSEEDLKKALVAARQETQDLKAEMGRTENEHDRTVQDMRLSLSQTGKEWEEAISGMRKEVSNLERQVEEKNHLLQCMQLELKASTNDLETIQKKLMEKDQEINRMEKSAATTQLSLENFIENLKEYNNSLDQTSKQNIAELLMDIDNLKQANEAETKAIEAKYEAMIVQLNRDWEVHCEKQVSQAIGKEKYGYMEEVESVRKKLLEESKYRESLAADKLSQENKQRIMELTNTMEQLRHEHSVSLEEYQKEFEREKATIVENNKRNLRETSKRLMETSDSREHLIREEMEKIIFALKQMHSKEAVDMKNYYSKMLEEAQQDLQDAKRVQETETQGIVQSWSEKLDLQIGILEQNHKSAIRDMKHSHTAALNSERSTWRHESDQLKQSVGNLESKIKKAEKQNEINIKSKLDLERSLAETRQALVQKTREMGETVHSLRQENQKDKACTEEKYQEAIEDMVARHSLQVSSMEDDFNAILSEERNINQQLDEQYMSVKKRFDSRESRQEDIERIASLEITLSAKEQEARKNAEQMVQLRNEMLLREDNYNKHFRNGGQAEKVLDVKGAMASTKGITDWLIQSKKRSQQMSGKARARRETD